MEGTYANIIVDISHEQLDRTFQYRIPAHLRGMLAPGALVRFPFGRADRLIRGYVLEITDRQECPSEKMKELSSVIKDDSLVEGKLIALAWWMKEHYGSTMIAALKTVIPIKKDVKARENRFIRLKLTGEAAAAQLSFYEKKHQTARYRLLSALLEQERIPWAVITNKLNISPQTIRTMAEQGVIEIEEERSYRNPALSRGEKGLHHVLNASQQQAADTLWQAWEAGERQPALLYGITGSGKTEVYMELIERMVESGRQAIVLIPEIALTYQTVMRFYQRFGERVSTLHSRLSEGERFDQFERARRGELDVMIGPRSALFTPFARLGLIVIDEEHEPSYKSESMPKYHARETAVRLAQLHGAAVVLGSATPSVDSYYKAKTGEYRLLTLPERAAAAACLPQVYTVDLREELKQGNRSILSVRLRELLEDRLQRGEQSMLFLNRRGYAGFISCRSCGHVMKCPHCDVSLSAHQGGRLVCHYCGHEEREVRACPVCSSPYIGGMRAGTQQVEQHLRTVFPGARVLRMDMDTTRKKGGHADILSAFSNREADILVGTQMIVKGHDFPYVTLVGILAADMSLHAGDYRAAERTFQLLTQAEGRAGRGSRPGEAVIQTYSPEHYAVQTAAAQDYEAFYEREIAYRSLLGYPPAAHLLAVLLEGPDEMQVKEAAMECYRSIADGGSGRKLSIIGPTEASISKLNDIYRQIMYCKSPEYGILTGVKDRLEALAATDGFQKKKLRMQLDFDPMNAY